VRTFIDRLQQVDSMLPLRTVPLEILPFTPVQGRLDAQHCLAMETQYRVLESWRVELRQRFTADVRGKSICEIRLKMK